MSLLSLISAELNNDNKIKSNKIISPSFNIPASPFGHHNINGFDKFKDIIQVRRPSNSFEHLSSGLYNSGSGRGGTGSPNTSFFKNSLKTLKHILMPVDELEKLQNAVSKTFGVHMPKKGIFHLTNGELEDISSVLKKGLKISEVLGDALVVLGATSGQPEIVALGGGILAVNELAEVGDEYLDKYVDVHRKVTEALGRESILPTQPADQDDHEIQKPDVMDNNDNTVGFPKSSFQDTIKLFDELDDIYNQHTNPMFKVGHSTGHARPDELNQHIQHTNMNEQSMYV